MLNGEFNMSVATRFILSKPNSGINNLEDFMNFRDSILTEEQQQEYTYVFTDAQLDGRWTGYKRAEWTNDSVIFTFINDDMLSARAFVQHLLANEFIRSVENIFLARGWKTEHRMEPSNDNDLTQCDKIILDWPDNAVHIRPERFTS
jgi:hypothetical protein